jgi:hypothetical protein
MVLGLLDLQGIVLRGDLAEEPHGVVGQAVHLLGQSLGIECLKRLDDPSVEDAPPLLEQTAVGDLVDQSVLEGEFALGKQPRLVEKLSCLQVVEATVQRLLRQLGNGLQQEDGHLGTDGTGARVAVRLHQSVDARTGHLAVRYDPARAHYFDPQNGQRIDSSGRR